jgi:hypothetical protein
MKFVPHETHNSGVPCEPWLSGDTGHTQTQLVKALRYKPEGHRFDSRRCHWNFSLTQTYWPHRGPGVVVFPTVTTAGNTTTYAFIWQPEAAIETCKQLLMMGTIMPETC